LQKKNKSFFSLNAHSCAEHMKIHESGAYVMSHAQVFLKNQQVIAFRESCKARDFNMYKESIALACQIISIGAIFCFRIILTLRLNRIRIVVQKYDARVIEVIMDTFNQTFIHVNWSDQLTPRKIECRP